MSHIIPAHGTGPWRILILDRDPQDPKWIMATVAIPSDVRPALLDTATGNAGQQSAADWVAGLTGRRVALVPVPGAQAWYVDEAGQ